MILRPGKPRPPGVRWMLRTALLILLAIASPCCNLAAAGDVADAAREATRVDRLGDGQESYGPLLAVGALIALVGAGMALIVLRNGRQRDRDALRRSEARLHRITRSMGEVIWQASADFSHLDYINPAYETIWGRRCRDLYDHPRAWFDFIFPEDRQAVLDHIAGKNREDRDGIDGGIEYRILRPEGDVRWIHARQFPVSGDDGVTPRVMGVGRDITRRKYFEASLREAEEKWRSLMENSPDHIMLMDLDGHILFANRGFMNMAKPDLVGKSLASLLAPAFGTAVNHCIDAVIKRGDTDACRVEQVYGDGQRAFFELRMGPVSVNGQTVAVAVNSTEITDRVMAENALKESEAFHRTIFDDTPTGIAVQDFSAVDASVKALKADGVTNIRAYLTEHPEAVSRLAVQAIVVRANPALEELYAGIGRQTVVGPLSRILLDDDRVHFIDQVIAFTGGQDRYEGEVRNIDFRGQTLHLILRKVVVNRNVNGLSKILTVLIDITPLKAAEKERHMLMLQLQQAQKMEAIGTLAGGVAHDFNNILSIILGNAELSLSDLDAGHPLRRNLQEIERASLRARGIVRQLLELSRRREQAPEPVHLIPVVREAVTFLRATLPADIAIQTDFRVENDVVRFDATQIHQIMINLFTNAGHAMEAGGGDLSVRAENVRLVEPLQGPVHSIAPGRYVRVSISDTGDGIPEEIRGRIFDPYFTTKPVGKGTGMGLAMVHGIMQNVGGGIMLDSGVGTGTTFDLYFPSADPAAVRPAAGKTPAPGGSERVLFVDDEPMITDLTGRMLDRLGYRVQTYTDPEAALSSIRSAPEAVDLVITDMAMPVMTGDRLAEAIRQLRPTLPMILCTGYRSRISEETVGRLGIDVVLDKPVEMETLATAIRSVLDGRRPQA